MTDTEIQTINFKSYDGQIVPVEIKQGELCKDFVKTKESYFIRVAPSFGQLPYGKYGRRSIALRTECKKGITVTADWSECYYSQCSPMGSWFGINPFSTIDKLCFKRGKSQV